ncbi:MAG TPA: hypothetical protein VFC78_14365 [Tepidisphaeraceae bacterium]|nr:hypothetical protein [Tepidisphaeraceae bacterium]
MTMPIDYVLPIGRADATGHLTRRSWTEFVRWVYDLSDALLLWSLLPRPTIADWLGVRNIEDLEQLAHSDPDCALNGYLVKVRAIHWSAIAGVVASEEFGIAYFSWQRAHMAFASVQVTDFENFAIFKIEPERALRLAKACIPDLSNTSSFAEYRPEITRLAGTAEWQPLSSVLIDATGAVASVPLV